ncbi:hypothetical protein CLOM_g14393 [Closterium sp. NIES-68]|nr:hypothetical protein CLOM_g14393 [Closterium sp. NIES-68]GJP70251.1 hypothetical protein CLOP_g1215 [Closterium sp. NIES-67]
MDASYPEFSRTTPPSPSTAIAEPSLLSSARDSPESTSVRHSSDCSDASPPPSSSSSIAFSGSESSSSASSSPLTTPSKSLDTHANGESSNALAPHIVVQDGKSLVQGANAPIQSPENKSTKALFREKLFAILRLARGYIRHPPHLPILVNVVVIVTMACGVFALLTGMYRMAFTSDRARADLLEFSSQVLQSAGTVAALLLHPTRLVYLLRLIRWRPSDVISLRKVFSRGDTAVAKPHERRHMAVVIGLLNVACISQYGIFLCLCLRAPDDRRLFPVLLFIFGAFGLGTVAGAYFLLCPLARPLPAESAGAAAPPEAHKRGERAVDEDSRNARACPAEKDAHACGLGEVSSRARGDGGEEWGAGGRERRERASVVRALFRDEENGDSGSCAGDEGGSDGTDSSSSSSSSGSTGSSGRDSSPTDRYCQAESTDHRLSCPPLALPPSAVLSPSSPSSRAVSCHLAASPHHPAHRLGSARLQRSRSQRSSSRHVDKRAVWQPRTGEQNSATAARGVPASEVPEWAGSLCSAADDCGIAARVALCCPCAFAWHLHRAGFGHPLFHALNLLLFLLAPPLVFTASARYMTDPALRALTIGFGATGALMGLLYGGYWRWKLRRTFDLPANTWACGHKAFSDFGAWVACPCCALCQEMRTVEANGLRVVAPDDAQLEVIVTGGKGGVYSSSSGSSSKGHAERDSVTVSVTKAPCVPRMELNGAPGC